MSRRIVSNYSDLIGVPGRSRLIKFYLSVSQNSSGLIIVILRLAAEGLETTFGLFQIFLSKSGTLLG